MVEEPGQVNKDWEVEKKRTERLSWWKELADRHEIKPETKVWHFHPTSLVLSEKRGRITVEFLEKILDKPGDWFTGVGGSTAFRRDFSENYPNIYKFNKKLFVKILNETLDRYSIKTDYQIAHFLSQCFHESAHFETTIEFASGNAYNPGVHADAEKNGNTELGDGPKYRGRGLIQLTWKKNYEKYSNHRGLDFVSNPDLVASDMHNAIDASCWYWRNNGAVSVKHNANGDINILIEHEPNNVKLITLAVNGGDNGLAERQSIFNKIKNEWSVE